MASIAAASTDGSIFPARRWHELYHAAIIELDSARLPGRIAEARQAIRQSKRNSATSRDERYFLNDALRSLLLLEAVAEREKRAPEERRIGRE